MDSFLKEMKFSKLEIENTLEIVYGKIFIKNNQRISLRIYTSITKNGLSRPIGTDAIRIVPFFLYNGNPVPVGKNKKILRIKTWKENLKKAIENWDEYWAFCDKCDVPMSFRKGPYGNFYACSTWKETKCENKISIPSLQNKIF